MATHDATRPTGPGRGADRRPAIAFGDWLRIGWRAWRTISAEHVSVLAAGVAFYGLLALFPAIAVLVSIGGLLVDPKAVEEGLGQATEIMPSGAAAIVTDQARSVAAADTGSLGLTAIGGLLLALWSASAATKTLMQGVGVAYGAHESRGLVVFNLTAYLLTFGLIAGAAVALGGVVVAPAVLARVGLGDLVSLAVDWLRWPLLAGFAILGLAILYRFGPPRRPARWRWITPGAVLATVVWLAVSVGFSAYVRNFGAYGETYGALGGVIVLLLWMWLSAYVVLVGAVLDAELERGTPRDPPS